MNKEIAKELLFWAEQKNPGEWIEHSYNVAKSAEIIAKNISLDCNLAYIYGLLHDIGRYEGIIKLRHVYLGYKLMNEKGFNNIAKICLTHSFPLKIIESYASKNDCTTEETNYLKKELENYEYDDYDKLIQLCDALGSAEGIVLMEMRFVDVVKRNGFNEYTIEKWKAFDEIKNYFEIKCRKKIYELFKNEIMENIIGKEAKPAHNKR